MRKSGYLQRKDKHNHSFPLQREGEPQELICTSPDEVYAQEYLVSEFARTKLPQHHIDWERAHEHLARSCLCYISVFLERSWGPDGSGKNEASFEHEIATRPMLHPLLDYMLQDALGHFQHIGPRIGSVLHDIKVLAEDIERNSWVWDNVCLGNLWLANDTTPRWPVSSHDFPLYFIVAFAPDSLLRAYLPRPVFKPKTGTNPLVYAACFNKHKRARTLLSRGTKLNYRGWETNGSRQALPIEVALRNGHHSMVTFFIEEGSIISPQIFTELLSYRYWSTPPSIQRILLQTDDFVEVVDGLILDPGLLLEYCKGILVAGFHGQDLIFIVQRMIQVSCDFSRGDLCCNEPFRLSPGEEIFQSNNCSTLFSIRRWSFFVKMMF